MTTRALPDQIKQTLGLVEEKNTSPWEHIQSYEEYEDFDAWLEDSDGLGVLLRLTLVPEEQRAYMSLRVLDENGNDYADGSNSISVKWDAAVRMSGFKEADA